MKEFGQWFADQGKGQTEEIDDTCHFTCRGCGKSEYLSWAEYEAGDSGWWVESSEVGKPTASGVCGSGPYCIP